MRRYDICFHPSWWHETAGIDFSERFWFDPEFRIQEDLKMRKVLFQKFGEYGLGEKNPQPRPILGSDHTACGFLFSQMLGCRVLYSPGNSPQVICPELDDAAAFGLRVPDFDTNPLWQKMESQMAYLQKTYGSVQCHMNLMGVQNIALDLRGQDLFMDYYDEDSPARHLLEVSCETMIRAGKRMQKYCPHLSAGVTNILGQVRPQNFCTSNCTVEMVSQQIYEDFLMEFDCRLARAFPDFGIHHCGATMEHVAKAYAKVPNLRFAEVGAFSDLAAVRDALPGDIQLNARFSPALLADISRQELEAELTRMRQLVPGPRLSISCVGIDSRVPEEKIRWFLEICRSLLDN